MTTAIRSVLMFGVFVLLLLSSCNSDSDSDNGTDPVTPVWTAEESGTAENINAIVWTGTGFVAAADSGLVLEECSTGWCRHYVGLDATLNDITWTGSQYVAVGDNGVIVTSTNLLNWNLRVTGTVENLHAVTWTGSLIVAVGDEGIIKTSPTGTVWTGRVSQTDQDLYGVTWTGGSLVAVGDSLAIVTSVDGDTWVNRGVSGPGQLRAVTMMGSQIFAAGFGAGGTSDTVLMSSNQTTWTGADAGTAGIQDLAETGLLVLAVSQATVTRSSDGLTWTPEATGLSIDILGIGDAGPRVVVVGANGAIAARTGY